MLGRNLPLGAALRSVAESRQRQEALVCGNRRLTYGDLWSGVESAAQALRAAGVRPGDRIVSTLTPGIEFATLFFAIAHVGAVSVPLAPGIHERHLSDVCQDCTPSLLLTGDSDKDARKAVPADYPPVLRASELIHQAHTEAMCTGSPQAEPGALAALLYTSGTTGRPKATMHSHRSLIAPVAASTKLRELWTRRPGPKQVGELAVAVARYGERLLRAAGRPQTFLSTVGWHTITGLEVMLQALLMGDRLVAMPRFLPREALALVQAERVTVLVAVPMAYQVLLGLEGAEQYDTSSLLICGTGSAPCPPDLARRIQARFGCALHIGFGATETGGGIAATSLADSPQRQAETVGKPMPGVQVRIVDEQRRELPRGQVGELACRSDGIMLGYYGATELSAEVIDADGWYYTGDLAVLDDKGYLRIVGRKKDTILRGGLTVYPAEIERHLVVHPKVREAAVVGVPAALEGESVWAFVILEPGVAMTAQEVKDHCRQALEPYQVPSRVRFMAELPRTENGKPRKLNLREAALSETEGKGTE